MRRVKTAASPAALPGERSGRIVAHLGVAVEVHFDDGSREIVKIKRNSGHVIGDRVMVTGEVLQRMPRRTELSRRDITGGIHLVAANLDSLGIVTAPAPAPTSGFIERAIVAARAAGLSPFLIANKGDHEGFGEFLTELQGHYGGIVEIFSVSAATGDGLDALRGFFSQGHSGVFIGSSGVGKSSILNRLCPAIDLRVGEINRYTSRGCHTTTVSTLHELADGGDLADTPGFQDFGLVNVTPTELALFFPGFEPARESTCRFRNCRHRSEPGCRVVALVERREIAAERYRTYLTILGEVEATEEEERRKQWKK